MGQERNREEVDAKQEPRHAQCTLPVSTTEPKVSPNEEKAAEFQAHDSSNECPTRKPDRYRQSDSRCSRRGRPWTAYFEEDRPAVIRARSHLDGFAVALDVPC